MQWYLINFVLSTIIHYLLLKIFSVNFNMDHFVSILVAKTGTCLLLMLIFFSDESEKKVYNFKNSISIIDKRFIILFSIHHQINIVWVTKLTSSNDISGCMTTFTLSIFLQYFQFYLLANFLCRLMINKWKNMSWILHSLLINQHKKFAVLHCLGLGLVARA